MVFKYADSGSLRSYLSDPSAELDWPTRCKLGINIANGLGYLHGRGIIHKDLVIIDVQNNIIRSESSIIIDNFIII